MTSLLTAGLAFVIGGFPTGVLISKWVHRKDIRHFGSQNVGAINVWRVFGFNWGLFVVSVDIGKGWVAAAKLPEWFAPDSTPAFAALCGLLAVSGHIWSPFTRFRGGKGVGAGIGALIALYPLVAAICTCIWITLVLITRYASIGALTTVLFYPALVYWYADPNIGELTAAMLLSAVIIYSHRQNIKRLVAGNELKVGHNRFLKTGEK